MHGSNGKRIKLLKPTTHLTQLYTTRKWVIGRSNLVTYFVSNSKIPRPRDVEEGNATLMTLGIKPLGLKKKDSKIFFESFQFDTGMLSLHI